MDSFSLTTKLHRRICLNSEAEIDIAKKKEVRLLADKLKSLSILSVEKIWLDRETSSSASFDRRDIHRGIAMRVRSRIICRGIGRPKERQ